MKRKRILIVDDSGTARMLEQAALARGPYDVTIAKDGAEGLERAKADPPDLILMDVMMPKMDGFAALRGIRELPATRHIPVIMVTTRGEPANVEQGFSSGANDFVTKPVNTLELLTKVKNLLGE